MRIYKSKWFIRFAKKERIADAKLCEAIEADLIESGKYQEVQYDDQD